MGMLLQTCVGVNNTLSTLVSACELGLLRRVSHNTLSTLVSAGDCGEEWVATPSQRS